MTGVGQDCIHTLYLINEQVSMRSIKTRGGLTRGKLTTENQRLVWGGGGGLSMPVCASTNTTIQTFSDVSYQQKCEYATQRSDGAYVCVCGDDTDTMNVMVRMEIEYVITVNTIRAKTCTANQLASAYT